MIEERVNYINNLSFETQSMNNIDTVLIKKDNLIILRVIITNKTEWKVEMKTGWYSADINHSSKIKYISFKGPEFNINEISIKPSTNGINDGIINLLYNDEIKICYAEYSNSFIITNTVKNNGRTNDGQNFIYKTMHQLGFNAYNEEEARDMFGIQYKGIFMFGDFPTSQEVSFGSNVDAIDLGELALEKEMYHYYNERKTNLSQVNNIQKFLIQSTSLFNIIKLIFDVVFDLFKTEINLTYNLTLLFSLLVLILLFYYYDSKKQKMIF